NLSTESNVRESDGKCGDGRELPTGVAGGKAQSRSSGDRPDEHRSIGSTPSSELVDSEREATEGELRSDARQAGRNTEAERREENVGYPDGTGPVHPAAVAASDDADLRSALQRAQLRISAGAQCTGRRASRTAVRAEGEGMGGGHRHHQILRPRQSRHFA